MFRQGDVLIIPVEEIPDGTKAIGREGGRLVLAHGEATGHAHVVEGPATFLASDVEELERRFLRVEAETALPIDAWQCRAADGSTVWIPADAEISEVEAAGMAVLGRGTTVGVAVRHDEHLPFVIPPGDHEVRLQREYTPEAPRRVAD